MRTRLLFAILICSMTVKAQNHLPLPFMDYSQRLGFAGNAYPFAAPDKKWFLSTYSGVSTDFIFFNGVSATRLAVPLGLQLNRRLTNNFYAFAGLSAAPAYTNFNHSFLLSNVNKMYPNNGSLPSGSFGMYSEAELGLMYINDAKTFSISGSFSVQSSYPGFPYQQTGTRKRNALIPANK